MKAKKYVQRMDNDAWVIKNKEMFRVACCDCNLVHDFVVVYDRGTLAIAAKRNNRATAQRRRKP